MRSVLDPKDEIGEKNSRLHEKQVICLRRFLKQLRYPWSRVLDFGCGIGRNYRLLREFAESYVGVDISPGMISRATQVVQPPDEVKLIDGATLPFDSNRFDLVFSFWVLQHIVDDDDLRNIAGQFAKCLGPGGSLVFCERSAATRSEQGMDIRYINQRPPREYMRLFSERGFSLVRFENMSYGLCWHHRLLGRSSSGDHLYAFQKA